MAKISWQTHLQKVWQITKGESGANTLQLSKKTNNTQHNSAYLTSSIASGQRRAMSPNRTMFSTTLATAGSSTNRGESKKKKDQRKISTYQQFLIDYTKMTAISLSNPTGRLRSNSRLPWEKLSHLTASK